MSKMISNTPDLEPEQSIQNTLRRVSFNPSSFKSSFSSLNALQTQKQHLLLDNLYKKINEQERQQIRIQAHQEARLQFKQLKGKLRKNASKQNIEGIMGDKKSAGHSLLSKVMKAPTDTIQIDKKYHKHISMKMTLFNEAQRIDSQKQSYAQWYDSTRNCRTNSPIYSRVNYLLERLGKQERKSKKGVQLQPLRKSLNYEPHRQRQGYRKIERKKTEESQFMRY